MLLMLLESFQSFIHQNRLIAPQQSTLIAISGGIDSVVLCFLFSLSEWPFALAHVNFQLRGSASDADAVFCKELADTLGVPFHETQLDTVAYASTKGKSIQLAAREFRYAWLEEIRVANNYTHIATAHHLNDSMETVIYNMTKGCGLKGLLGIPLRNGKVIRPLLFAARLEIEAYALEQDLSWREDASNASLKYRRNQIRHQVIPPLRAINPGFDQTAAGNLQRWQESYQLYQRMVTQLRGQLVKEIAGVLRIDAIGLADYPEQASLLYEWLSPYGFTEAIIRELLAGEGSGRQFLSPTHRLVTTAEVYLVALLEEKKSEVILIEKEVRKVKLDHGQQLVLHWLENAPEIFPNNPKVAYLDRESLTFPLKLRRWQAGDRFQPLGMNGQHRKLQDFFSDQKLSLVEKDLVWVMESAGEICWVVGMRVDERFRVKDKKGACLELRLNH